MHMSGGRPQVFEFTDAEGITHYFSIPVLRESIKTTPDLWTLETLPITRWDATFVSKNRGVAEARVRAFPLKHLDEPGIGLYWRDGSMLTADGNHRLVKRVRRGMSTMDFWTASEPVWRAAVLDPTTVVKIA